MIFLQLAALLIWLPMSLITLLLFNVCFSRWLGWVVLLVYSIIYSLAFSLLCLSLTAGIIFFALLLLLYLLRIYFIKRSLRRKNNTPVLYVDIQLISFIRWRLSFIFPLAIIAIGKYLPKAICRKIEAARHLNTPLLRLIDECLENSRGTCLNIRFHGADICVEIK